MNSWVCESPLISRRTFRCFQTPTAAEFSSGGRRSLQKRRLRIFMFSSVPSHVGCAGRQGRLDTAKVYQTWVIFVLWLLNEMPPRGRHINIFLKLHRGQGLHWIRISKRSHFTDGVIFIWAMWKSIEYSIEYSLVYCNPAAFPCDKGR